MIPHTWALRVLCLPFAHAKVMKSIWVTLNSSLQRNIFAHKVQRNFTFAACVWICVFGVSSCRGGFVSSVFIEFVYLHIMYAVMHFNGGRTITQNPLFHGIDFVNLIINLSLIMHIFTKLVSLPVCYIGCCFCVFSAHSHWITPFFREFLPLPICFIR